MEQATSDGQLAREIERTREQLGETVRALAARADLKAMAAGKLGEFPGRAADTVTRAGHQATAQARRLRDQGAGRAARQWQQLRSGSMPVKGKLRKGTSGVAVKMSHATVDPVLGAVATAAAIARQRRVPAAIAVAGAALAGLAIVWWRRTGARHR
jgi:hypothetical protein